MTIKGMAAGLVWLGCLAWTATVQAQQADDPEEKREPEKPIMSRDGKKIVYQAGVTRPGEILPSRRELWIVNVDGTGARRLTEGPADQTPRFSPDGRQITFTRDGDIWVIDADGGGLRNVTNTKDHRESAPEFTNDGQLLVFLRSSPDDLDEKTKAEIIRETPMAALGFDNVQSVVLRNLQAGTERVLLGDGYGVVQVVSVEWDNNVVFILCDLIDNNGKPVGRLTLDKEVAVLRLDGSLPSSVFRLKPGTKMSLRGFRARQTRNVFEVGLSDKIGTHVAMLQDGEVILLPDAPLFGDLSADGNIIIGTGVIDDKFNIGIVLYDIVTKKETPLR